MGHSSIKVTETYLKPFENEKVDIANDELIISVVAHNAIKNRMTIIKRKTFIIKHFARFAEQTDLQKKTKYCDVSVTRLLAACFENNGR